MESPEIYEENIRKPKIEGYSHFFLQPTLTKKGFNPWKHLNLSILATSSDHRNSMEKNKHPLSGSIPLDHLKTSAESAGYPIGIPRGSLGILYEIASCLRVDSFSSISASNFFAVETFFLARSAGPVRKPVGCGAQAGRPPQGRARRTWGRSESVAPGHGKVWTFGTKKQGWWYSYCI